MSHMEHVEVLILQFFDANKFLEGSISSQDFTAGVVQLIVF
jgi:hypothetical protein